jgi:hypothetical protein
VNTANIVTISIPTLTVLIGILMNRQDTTALRAELKSEIGGLRNEMRSEIGSLRNEMFQLRDSIHRDMIGLHERLATVEAKQAS